MSTPLYDALVTKIRTWVNRDSNVITDALISDFLDYSADLCYRKLRVPPLEYTHTYPVITALSGLDETEISVPTDLSEFIQFRKTDADGNSYVFDERTSILAMQDKDYNKQAESFARKGDTLVFYPAAKVGDIYELYYYRRLSDINAVYTVNEVNRLAGLTTISTSGTTGAVETPIGSGNYYVGNEVPNWLRDENERILMWGAVAYAFDYVGEDERAAKFNAQQLQGILELNDEEILRKVRGGQYRQTFSVTDQF
jgi:hypothetical protein